MPAAREHYSQIAYGARATRGGTQESAPYCVCVCTWKAWRVLESMRLIGLITREMHIRVVVVRIISACRRRRQKQRARGFCDVNRKEVATRSMI